MNTILRKQIIAWLVAIFAAVSFGNAVAASAEDAGEYVEDSVITTKVKAAILGEPRLKVAEINVETFKGTVQLSGFVRDPADIGKAGDIARSVKGVKSVKNDVRVK